MTPPARTRRLRRFLTPGCRRQSCQHQRAAGDAFSESAALEWSRRIITEADLKEAIVALDHVGESAGAAAPR
jgi:hypothetical protein